MTGRCVPIATVVAITVLLSGAGLAYGFGGFVARGVTDASPGVGGFLLAHSVHGKRATLWAVGDGDGGVASLALTDRIAASRFDRLIYLGDVYEKGTADEFARNYAPTFGRFAARTVPTPGNHDWENHRSGYDPYWARALHRTKVASWYAFSAGGWRILSLNSQVDHRRGSPQWRWLRAQLRTGGTCRIAFWHRGRYGAGPHGDSPDMAPIWNELRGHARLVLSSYDHDMQRMRPIDGITEFLSGAGGHNHQAVDRRYDHLAFADDTHVGALRLRLRPGRAHVAFVAKSGRVLDSGAVRCRPLA